MISYQAATISDIGQIVQLLQMLRLESPEYNYADDDPEYVSNNLHELFTNKTMVGSVAIAEHKTLVGFMIGVVGAHWYSKRIDAMEQLLYIDPAWRGGSVAPRLIKHFEWICQCMGAHTLYVGASTGMAEERTVKLYERMGYTKGSPALRKAL